MMITGCLSGPIASATSSLKEKVGAVVFAEHTARGRGHSVISIGRVELSIVETASSVPG